LDRALAFDKEARWADAASMRRAVQKALIKLDAPDSGRESPSNAAAEPQPATETAPAPGSDVDPETSVDAERSEVAPAAVADADDQEPGQAEAAPSRASRSMPPTWSDETSLPDMRIERRTTTSGVAQDGGRRAPQRMWLGVAAAGGIVVMILTAAMFRRSTAPLGDPTATSAPEPAATAALAPVKQPSTPDVVPMGPADQPGVVSIDSLPIAKPTVQIPPSATAPRLTHPSLSAQPSASPSEEPIVLEETPQGASSSPTPSAIPAAAFPSSPSVAPSPTPTLAASSTPKASGQAPGL
jgi:hypothetical protein